MIGKVAHSTAVAIEPRSVLSPLQYHFTLYRGTARRPYSNCIMSCNALLPHSTAHMSIFVLPLVVVVVVVVVVVEVVVVVVEVVGVVVVVVVVLVVIRNRCYGSCSRVQHAVHRSSRGVGIADSAC